MPLTYGPIRCTGLLLLLRRGSPTIHFTDVPVSDAFCKHVHYLWAEGNHRRAAAARPHLPRDAVTRDAMAKFIVNGFGLQLYGP